MKKLITLLVSGVLFTLPPSSYAFSAQDLKELAKTAIIVEIGYLGLKVADKQGIICLPDILK